MLLLSGHFRLDPKSGQLKTAINLNYEEVSQYVILVEANEDVSSAAQVPSSGNFPSKDFPTWIRAMNTGHFFFFCICNQWRELRFSLIWKVWQGRQKVEGPGSADLLHSSSSSLRKELNTWALDCWSGTARWRRLTEKQLWLLTSCSDHNPRRSEIAPLHISLLHSLSFPSSSCTP